MLGQRGGNAHQNGVVFRETGKICCRGESLLSRSLNLRGWNAEDVGLAGLEIRYFLGIDIEASDIEPGFGQEQRQRQPDVTESDDSNSCRAGLKTVKPLLRNLGQNKRTRIRHVPIIASGPMELRIGQGTPLKQFSGANCTKVESTARGFARDTEVHIELQAAGRTPGLLVGMAMVILESP